MKNFDWHKQNLNEPLFSDLLWSRPENRAHAGKLLIVGGNLHGFAAPAQAYGAALMAGIGTARVMLPSAVKKAAGNLLPDLEYGASTPSGSFSQAAFGELIEHGQWADGVIFAGDLGHNSETAVLLEKFLSYHSGLVALTKDAANYSLGLASLVLNRPDTLLIITTAQLQKLAMAIGYDKPFKLGMDLLQLTENLHNFTLQFAPHIIVRHNDQLAVATEGKVSTTKLKDDHSSWRIQTSAYATVWLLQNPQKPFEALTTAVYECHKTVS